MPRPRILDKTKRAEICALLAAGCSQEAAARYVGVSSAAIRNAARRDPAFRQQILKALGAPELQALKNIRTAGRKSWRAAAWLLERTRPQQYGYRSPRVLPLDYLAGLFEEFTSFVRDLLPDAKSREELDNRIERALARRQRAAFEVEWPFAPVNPPYMPEHLTYEEEPQRRPVPPPKQVDSLPAAPSPQAPNQATPDTPGATAIPPIDAPRVPNGAPISSDLSSHP